ncbi:MAG: hypothetical protein JWN01_247 [Patescibacteria group bacterium]|nr:hypothetical protein [Patescibacteria group bacterium]
MNKPSTSEIVAVASELLVPMSAVERTIRYPVLGRWENDADHSYLLATLGCALACQIDQKLDLGKISQYALVHDLVEVHAGDTTIWAEEEWRESKTRREADALQHIEKRFGTSFPWIAKTIHVYERLDEPESCFVYALDKLLPYIVMDVVDHQPFPPTRDVYEEKMATARQKISRYPKLLAYFEDLYAQHKDKPHFFASD